MTGELFVPEQLYETPPDWFVWWAAHPRPSTVLRQRRHGADGVILGLDLPAAEALERTPATELLAQMDGPAAAQYEALCRALATELDTPPARAVREALRQGQPLYIWVEEPARYPASVLAPYLQRLGEGQYQVGTLEQAQQFTAASDEEAFRHAYGLVIDACQNYIYQRLLPAVSFEFAYPIHPLHLAVLEQLLAVNGELCSREGTVILRHRGGLYYTWRGGVFNLPWVPLSARLTVWAYLYAVAELNETPDLPDPATCLQLVALPGWHQTATGYAWQEGKVENGEVHYAGRRIPVVFGDRCGVRFGDSLPWFYPSPAPDGRWEEQTDLPPLAYYLTGSAPYRQRGAGAHFGDNERPPTEIELAWAARRVVALHAERLRTQQGPEGGAEGFPTPVRYDVWLPPEHAAELVRAARRLGQGRATFLRALLIARLDRQQQEPLPRAPTALIKVPLEIPPDGAGALRAARSEHHWPSVSELVRALVAEWYANLGAVTEEKLQQDDPQNG